MLSRLRRMAGFESQNFDPVVRPSEVFASKGTSTPANTSSRRGSCRRTMLSESFRYTVQRVTTLVLRPGAGSWHLSSASQWAFWASWWTGALAC